MKKPDALVNNSWPLELIQNRDIIQSVANYPSRPFTVGFAAETTNIISHAKQKLIKKNLDMIIANDVSDDSVGFNSDENKTTVLWKNHQKELPMMSKAATASHIIAIIAETLDKDTDD